MRKAASDPRADESRSVESTSRRYSDVQPWSLSVDDDWSTPSPREGNNVSGDWTGRVRNLLDMFDPNISDNFDDGDGQQPVSAQPSNRLMRSNVYSNIAEECSGDHQLDSPWSSTAARPADGLQRDRPDQRGQRLNMKAPDATNAYGVTARKSIMTGSLPKYKDRFSDDPADLPQSSSNPVVKIKRSMTAKKNQSMNASVGSVVPSSTSRSAKPLSQSASISPRLSHNTKQKPPLKSATVIPIEVHRYEDDYNQQQQQPDYNLLGARAKTQPRFMKNMNGSNGATEAGAQQHYIGGVPTTVETKSRIPKSDFRSRRNASSAGTHVHENEELIDVDDHSPSTRRVPDVSQDPNGGGEWEEEPESEMNMQVVGRQDDYPTTRQMPRRYPPKPVAGNRMALRPTASATTTAAAKMSPRRTELVDTVSSVDTSRRVPQHHASQRRRPQIDQQQASAAADTYGVSQLLGLTPLGVNQLQQGDGPYRSTSNDVDNESGRSDYIPRRSSTNDKNNKRLRTSSDLDAELNRVESKMSSAAEVDFNDPNVEEFLVASRRNTVDHGSASERPPTNTTQRLAGSGDHRLPSLNGTLNDQSSASQTCSVPRLQLSATHSGRSSIQGRQNAYSELNDSSFQYEQSPPLRQAHQSHGTRHQPQHINQHHHQPSREHHQQPHNQSEHDDDHLQEQNPKTNYTHHRPSTRHRYQQFVNNKQTVGSLLTPRAVTVLAWRLVRFLALLLFNVGGQLCAFLYECLQTIHSVYLPTAIQHASEEPALAETMYTVESLFYCITDDWMLLLLVFGGLCCLYILASSFFVVLNMW